MAKVTTRFIEAERKWAGFPVVTGMTAGSRPKKFRAMGVLPKGDFMKLKTFRGNLALTDDPIDETITIALMLTPITLAVNTDFAVGQFGEVIDKAFAVKSTIWRLLDSTGAVISGEDFDFDLDDEEIDYGDAMDDQMGEMELSVVGVASTTSNMQCLFEVEWTHVMRLREFATRATTKVTMGLA
jgi:hypothetical protein